MGYKQKTMVTSDRGHRVVCQIEENAFSITVGEKDNGHQVALLFTAECMREMRDFMDSCSPLAERPPL